MHTVSRNTQLLSSQKVVKALFVIIVVLTVVSFIVAFGTTNNSVRVASKLARDAYFNKSQFSMHGTIQKIKYVAEKAPGTASQWRARIQLNRTSTLTHVEFKDMPNPCAKPRRNTGVEDLLCMEPLEFLPNYKNPCWMDAGVLRCLPYFYLFGVCKTGTSDLFKRLYLHPDILPNKGILEKETWFWSFRRYTTKKVGNMTVYKTLTDFTDYFKAYEIEKAADSHDYHNKITGHGDPMDLWDRFKDVNIPQNDPMAKEFLWTSAFLVRKVNPDVKLLLMLRDPIQRLYSIYFHLRFGKTSADFHADVVSAIPVWKHCVQHNSMRHCIYNKSLKDKMKVPLYSSFYAFHLKEWLRAFPREHILVMRNEDYAKDIKGTLKEIFTFLNVSIPNDTLMHELEQLKHFYQTERKTQAGPIQEETRELLLDLYREPTQELADLLEDRRFAFEDVSFS